MIENICILSSKIEDMNYFKMMILIVKVILTIT